MRKLFSVSIVVFLLFVSFAGAADNSPNKAAADVYRISLPINAHPDEVLPALLTKKPWLPGYVSLEHLSGERWAVGEVVEVKRAIGELISTQREEILELQWGRRLTLKFVNESQNGFAFYQLKPTSTGVDLLLVVAVDQASSVLPRSKVAERVSYNEALRNLRLDHRRLKNFLENKAEQNMRTPQR